ncbi:alpha/beta fold hydrolase [Candidatus Aquiluna sp. UB-MaderosW2red]|uniref:alpha/beta fold hydrolase n=1 Tax=Candidatus Aquiluna sp. UB-MaderosW2red TaxID=1855377 RepID=UPI000875BB64|nr:alpha/beta fold hydrolase [Candidatus Aquiluna sp. UB-MaderosW2red]SCX14813.1 Lysophospholipase, alpha-beta hydrolase superfamily [Candidatus Aquiluna sp. UB-MaderosW2red]
MDELKPTPWTIKKGIAGFHWPSKKAKAQLLLQHGLGEYSERYVAKYNELIPKLLENDFDVYAIDLPGHGRSDGERGLVDLHEGLKYHLMARSLLPNSGLPTFLYGHSLGGLVTAASVMANPSGITAAVIGSSALHLPSKLWERALGGIMGRIAPNADVAVPRPGLEALSRDLQIITDAENDPMFYPGKAKNLVAKTVIELSDEIWQKVGEWKVPTLIMHGDQDTSTDVNSSRALFEQISSVDKELKIYPGGFHELLNDLDKDQATKDLIDWLNARV